MLAYKPMEREDLEACALLAAEAFYDYEYFSIYVPEDQRRHRFLDLLVMCEFKANWGRSAVRFLTAKDNGSVLAVAQLCTPDFRKPSDTDYIKAGWFGVMFKGGIKRVNAWNDMEKLASAPCHELKGKNWYLSLLTVSKTAEGTGVGSRFLNECLIPYVKDASGNSLSLFTNSEVNRRFYEKNGFTQFDEKRFTYEEKSIGSWSYIMML